MLLSKNHLRIAGWLLVLIPHYASTGIKVGVSSRDITPPLGTPSAGCLEREGKGMQTVHDPLLAQAMIIDTGEKLIALVSVDHLGFLRSMVNDVIDRVHAIQGLEQCEVFIGASHSHSGGGAYFDLPELGDLIAGPYDGRITQNYIAGVVRAIIEAYRAMQPALIGIGYGTVSDLTEYYGQWPKSLQTPTDLMVMKVTTKNGDPLAVWYNHSLYPDILVFSDVKHPLPQENVIMGFSADVIGFVNRALQSLIGARLTTVFFNGPIAEVLTKIPYPEDRFKSCASIGQTVAQAVHNLWQNIEVQDELALDTHHHMYLFEPRPTLSGFTLPVEPFSTQISLLVLNKTHAIVAIPAEFHCSYDAILKEKARQLGFEHLTVLSMVNDNHGYIYPPESGRLNPPEGEFSWGGEFYGKFIEERVVGLLSEAHSIAWFSFYSFDP